MKLLRLDAPPLTHIHPQHRPMALTIMGLRNRLDEQGVRPQPAPKQWPDGYERLVRRLLDAGDDGTPLIQPAARSVVVAGLWSLLADLDDHRQAEMVALVYGLDVEPTLAMSQTAIGSLYGLQPDQVRRLAQQAEAALRASPRLITLRDALADA